MIVEKSMKKHQIVKKFYAVLFSTMIIEAQVHNLSMTSFKLPKVTPSLVPLLPIIKVY